MMDARICAQDGHKTTGLDIHSSPHIPTSVQANFSRNAGMRAEVSETSPKLATLGFQGCTMCPMLTSASQEDSCALSVRLI